MGHLKSDHIKKLITITVDYIKCLSLYIILKTFKKITAKQSKEKCHKLSVIKKQPRVNFINVLGTHFLQEILAPKITKLYFGFEIFWRKNIGTKCAHKMLMILTTILTLDQTNGRACTKKPVATTYISLHLYIVFHRFG